ncbi:MAG: hypothetical protein H0X62_13615 [Bacteroidetes bacterium]|nr:hypothetical protein [Bacteroidota bacterium]
MKNKKKEKPKKSDKKQKPQAHQAVGTGVEKGILAESTQDMPGKAEQKRKLKAR